MKKLLLLFLLSSISVQGLAGVGDVYYCHVNQAATLTVEDVINYDNGQLFTFKRTEKNIEFGSSSVFSGRSYPITANEVDGNKEFFLAGGGTTSKFFYRDGLFLWSQVGIEDIFSVVATCEIFSQ